MNIRRHLGLIVALAVVASLSGQQPIGEVPTWDQIRAAIAKGDFAAALRLSTALAERGDVDAAGYVGYLLDTGKTEVRDASKAAEWYRYAAVKGDVASAYNLGLLYERGDGVTKDNREAFQWYAVAAQKGNAQAQLRVGWLYHTGTGVAQNEAAAVSRWQWAADNGNAEAQDLLGERYEVGNGVTKNISLALKWYRAAAAQGNPHAQGALGVVYANGDGVAQDYSEAFKWFMAAAQGGNDAAQRNIGILYKQGRGVLQDYVQAFYWYMQAAEHGNVQAQVDLGQLYADGFMAAQDYARAYMWFNVAATASSEAAEDAQERRDRLVEQMTPQQIAEGQALSRSWHPSTTKVGIGPIASNPQPTLASSGTGFFINREGNILTNHHVVDGCSAVRWGAPSKAAQVIASDPQNDLAVLKTDYPVGHVAAFSTRDASLGQPVHAVGFPLRGTLASGLNATTGTISALAGLRDDSRFVQITAPVQPGNSGGPLLATNGAVLGIITSKLSPAWAISAIGDIPQNVNFAIRTVIVRVFLEAKGIAYVKSTSANVRNQSSAIDAAHEFTVPVECWK
jgi:TPR repeat protein